MRCLEKLTQDEFGTIHRGNGEQLPHLYVLPVGKIRTLVVANPVLDISDSIHALAENYPSSIPLEANAYVASDFSGDTQHLRKSTLEGNEKFYCVFAVQFYFINDVFIR